MSFLPGAPGFLAWAAFVPLLVALERRLRSGAGLRSLFGLGWCFGLAFYLLGTYWIALLSDVAITVPWLKYPAWLLAGAYLALYAGLAAALAGGLARATGLSLAPTFPVAYLVVEELRASGELGFPWFQPGYTQHAYVPLIQMASLGSVSLVTLWLLVLNVLLWRAVTGTARARAALGALLALLLPWLWGTRVLEAAPRASGPAVALVQANVAGEIKWSGKHQREILDTFLRMTERAAADTARPSVILWPETATGSYLRHQIDQTLAVVETAARTRVPVFSGYADYAFGPDGQPRYYNAAGMFRPDGRTMPVYAKRHLVPFGERMPFQWLVPALGRLDLGQAEWAPGPGPVLFEGGTGRFSCLICFEAIFPDLAREDVRQGATWLVNVTNDEWFGNSAALYQHAAMSVFRAVENHVPLARCANTGLTLVTDGRGRIVGQAPVWTPHTLVARLAPPGPPTPYTSVGDWPGLGCGLAAAAGLLAGAWRALTRRARAS